MMTQKVKNVMDMKASSQSMSILGACVKVVHTCAFSNTISKVGV